MIAQRIKGQDTEVQVIKGGSVIQAVTAIKSWDITFELDITSQGYIGETTERKDSTFKGVSGKITLDNQDPDVIEFLDSLVKRARREVPYFEVNILSTLNYPDGTVKRIIVRDAQFASPGLSSSGMADFIETTLDWQASEYKLL